MDIKYSKQELSPKSWNDIEEIGPDEIDIKMLKDIKANPDCKEFLSSSDIKKELGI